MEPEKFVRNSMSQRGKKLHDALSQSSPPGEQPGWDKGETQYLPCIGADPATSSDEQPGRDRGKTVYHVPVPPTSAIRQARDSATHQTVMRPAALASATGIPVLSLQSRTARWEQQSNRYPQELQEIMRSETQALQALVVSQPLVTEQQLEKSKKQKKKRRVPEMRQVTAVECGAACIAMILNYYGYATSVSSVQERCGVGRDGLSALDIVKSARLYGLRVRAVSLNPEDFRFVTLPAIVHWEFNHFMVVERWSPDKIEVVDPAVGRRTLTPKEFDEGFTGVTILQEPGAEFKRKAPQKSMTPWSYIRSFLTTRTIIAQVIMASLLLQIVGLGLPLLTEVVVDDILPGKDPSLMTVLGLGMLILVFMEGVTLILRTSLLIYLQTRIDAEMMLNFFEHLLSLPYRFFQLRLNGDVLARVNSNLTIRDLFTNQLLSALLDGGMVIVYFLVLLIFSRLFATITLAIGIVQAVLLLLTAPTIRNLTGRDLEAQGKTQGYTNEILSGIATIKATGSEQQALARWTSLFFEEMNVSLRLNYLSSNVGIILSIVNTFSHLLLLWVGVWQVINGTMSTGTMLALNTLAVLALAPISSLVSSGQQLQTAGAHFSRVADIINAEPEQRNKSGLRPLHRLSGRIELKHIGFQYHQNAPMILNDINVTIYPRQKVALVGKSGSGKSTLGKLLVGLITPTKGVLLYDGTPLDQLNYQELRSYLGVVLQESAIFSGSVRQNIALNNPGMSMGRIMEAARLAAIADDIEQMPMGYDTLVSEGGSALSGGQRQRLALARALATHPAILMMDEATSALDVMTEQIVERNLRQLPCTQIIIAHRLSTIRSADLILVLDHGKIVEYGTHEQLLRRNGFYAQLVQAQLRNDEKMAARKS